MTPGDSAKSPSAVSETVVYKDGRGSLTAPVFHGSAGRRRRHEIVPRASHQHRIARSRLGDVSERFHGAIADCNGGKNATLPRIRRGNRFEDGSRPAPACSRLLPACPANGIADFCATVRLITPRVSTVLQQILREPKRQPGAIRIISGAPLADGKNARCISERTLVGWMWQCRGDRDAASRHWQPQLELSVTPLVPQHDSFDDASQHVV
jgi:hypothetical protein